MMLLSGAVTMLASKPPLLRISALLPLTGEMTFHVPARLAHATRSFCRTVVAWKVFTARGVDDTSPAGVVLRWIEGGDNDGSLRQGGSDGAVPSSGRGRVMRGDSLASDGRRGGASLEINWDACLKASESEAATE